MQYLKHRAERDEQIVVAVTGRPRTAAEIVREVYPDLAPASSNRRQWRPCSRTSSSFVTRVACGRSRGSGRRHVSGLGSGRLKSRRQFGQPLDTLCGARHRIPDYLLELFEIGEEPRAALRRQPAERLRPAVVESLPDLDERRPPRNTSRCRLRLPSVRAHRRFSSENVTPSGCITSDVMIPSLAFS